MQERKSDRVEFIAPHGSGERILFDLSRTGAGCYHSTYREPGSFVVLQMNDLALRAKVVHCLKRQRDYRLGLEFCSALPEQRKRLDELVEKYSKGVPVRCEVRSEKDAE